jgi:hypothetical protein
MNRSMAAPTIGAFFEDSSRESTLPMVRGFEDALTSARFWGSDYF